MFVELHLLQNFAPSNLNRDDTGSPKECEFGGYRRARVSSQCLKRSIRDRFHQDRLLPANDLGLRTKYLVNELAERLNAQGKDKAIARDVATVALAGVEIKLEDGRTQYLLFAGEREIAKLADVCLRYWDVLAQAPTQEEPAEDKKPSRSSREAKKIAKAGVPQEVRQAVRDALDGGKAVDVALFGRMLADLPLKNVDAACQVAHALSTHRVGIEFDFYSAMEERPEKEDAGAGMLGTIEFNSACFYRYANIDLRQLAANLEGDEALAREAVRAFLRAAIDAIPSGKQNSMAAHNPPSFVLGVVRETGLWSLANAFLDPVRVGDERRRRDGRDLDLMEASIVALDELWGKLTRMYGTGRLRGIWHSTGEQAPLRSLAGTDVAGVDELIDRVLAAAYPAQPERAQ